MRKKYGTITAYYSTEREQEKALEDVIQNLEFEGYTVTQSSVVDGYDVALVGKHVGTILAWKTDASWQRETPYVLNIDADDVSAVWIADEVM